MKKVKMANNASARPNIANADLKVHSDLKANYDEIGFVDGNYEDKYNTKNPISAKLVGGFLRNFKDLARMFEEAQTTQANQMPHKTQNNAPQDIVEIGSGEGHLVQILADMYPDANIVGCDLSERVNDLARKRLASYPKTSIQKEDAEKVTFKSESFDAAVCCEVLEHIPHPHNAISELNRILKAGSIAIVSVPHEPIWRMLNMARFKYMKDFGNTPGHLNHWTRPQFKKFIEDAGFTIVRDHSPFPWSMLLIQKNA